MSGVFGGFGVFWGLGVLESLGILGCFGTFGCFGVWGVLGFVVFGGLQLQRYGGDPRIQSGRY